MKEIKSTCCYCGVGCGVLIATDGAQIRGVRGDPEHPANLGKLCSKGSTLHLSAQPVIQQQVRALYPEIRTKKNLPRVRSDWDSTLNMMAEKFATTIREHGPDSVGFYISGQLLTEDYYVFNKLAKGLIGTNNIDSNSRLCMSSAVAAYKQTLGADAPPCSYEDIDHAEVIFIAGSNTAFAHPVLYRRIEEARKNNPRLKVIVADPRRTDTARDADLHLAILPGTDVALFNGMLHLCLWEELTDAAFIAAHTEGFAELRQTVRDYTPAMVAQTCGIKEADLLQAARWFGGSAASLSLYCQGLNQSSSGTVKNAALINLHLATHQIGKLGAGPFSLTGQPNAMGGREVGGMANLLSAHRDLGNAADRAEVAQYWGVDEVPATPGKTAVELFEAVRAGQIRLLWIVCTNPAQSMPEQNLIREALQKAEMVIVQEAYATTATVPYADVLLPATTWGEKSGTVTNSERRISRVNAAIAAPAETKHDWQIAAMFAQKLALLSGKSKPDFTYETPEQIWNEHRDSTRGRDLDITGLSYALLEQKGSQQWPYPQGASTGKTRLYEDHIFATPNGRARFVNTAYQATADKVDPRHPFALTTGRLRDQWHGMSRTGTVPQLFAHAAEPVIHMHPQDMQRRFLKNGDLVHVSNRRGTQIFAVSESEDLRAGQTFIGMHWGEEFISGRGHGQHAAYGVNALMSPATDPVSHQPELKHAAVKIIKAELPWRFVVFGWMDATQIFKVQQALRPYLRQFTYASCVSFGRENSGLLFRAADDVAASAELIQEIEKLFGIAGATVLRYDDQRRGTGRHIAIRDGQLQAVALTGDVAAESWLKPYLIEQQPVAKLGRLLLMPGANTPQGFQAKGKVICTCLNVAESQIEDALNVELTQADATPADVLAGLQNRLRCGTSCGSCVPEIRRMIALKKPEVLSV